MIKEQRKIHPTNFFFLSSLLTSLFSLLTFPLAAQDEVRANTIKYGTETEIAALIQTLKTENDDSLDNDIITLVGNTRNQQILAGTFSFFGDREKSGLEDRAIRAVEERDDEENTTVLAAIDYLGKVKAKQAAPALQEVLESGERRFMNAAFRAYGRIGGTASTGGADTTEYLIDFYKNRDPGDDNRREVITAIGTAGSAAAVEFLADIATNGDERPALRMAALESLAKIGDLAGLDAVISCVSANDPNIRSTAVTALGPFSGSNVDEAILEAFRDSYYRTRIAAAQASRQRKLVAAIPYLKFRAERDEVPAVKEDSLRALGAIANSDAVAALEGLFTERKNNDRVRIISGEMLMQIQGGQFIDSLVKELDEAKQKNHTALYNGLLKVIGEAKCSGMETITRRLLQDKGVVERSYALDMAANNNLTSLTADIRPITEDRNETLARKARRTLESLGG